MSETDPTAPKASTKSPRATAFNQQRLPAWQPVYTAKSVFPIYAIISVLFIGVGVLLLFTSWEAIEYSRDYTDCVSLENPAVQCSSTIENANVLEAGQTCYCAITIEVPESTKLAGDVFVYYGLNGFYQNHRRYVKSRDNSQLVGENIHVSNVSGNCAPYDKYRNNGQEQVIAPCGAIANSLFNDTFSVSWKNNISVPILRTGIAWPTDHSDKFKNPPGGTQSAFSHTRPPPFWRTPVQYLDNSTESNNGYKHEPLIVWMRVAAFPNFRKLYGRLDRQNVLFQDGLPSGNYTVVVAYNYPVTGFGGRKRVILATTTWMGGKNDFLGVAYICSGIVSGFLCVVLLAIHKFGNKMH